ncbi:MAG: putative peptidoglycan lipid flippase [Acidimicrobiaceae bacterium]|nr:putative peptidoglycan lipid flippase [Acidimicrobiaceae bacterium]
MSAIDVEGAGAESDPAGLSRNTAVMAAGTVLSRLSGFGRVLALAYALDFRRLTDSYNLANTTPNIVYELVLGGVLSATLIPVFIDQFAKATGATASGSDDDTAWRNISALVTVATVAMVILAGLFALAAPAVIHLYTLGNHTPSVDDQRAVATTLLRLFAPQVVLLGLITLSTALLNVRRRFAAPMWSPILLNVWTIGVLVALPHIAHDLRLSAVRHNTTALLVLGLGTTLGYAVQLGAVLPSLRRAGVRLRPVWEPGNQAVHLMLRLSGWTLGVVAANQAAYWVILVLANGKEGGVSAYQAAFLFFQLPHAILAVSIMSALMPDLSERWARADVAGFTRQLALGLRTTAAVLIPAAAGYALLAHPFVRLVLEHGSLSPDKAKTTADVLRVFALGLPGFSLYLLLMRAYQAMKDTRSMFFLYLGENAITVAAALVLYRGLGVTGLAIAFAGPYTLFSAIALLRLRRAMPELDLSELGRVLARILVATAAMSAVVAGLTRVVSSDLLQVGSAVAAGGTVYVLGAKALGVDDLVALLRIRRRHA